MPGNELGEVRNFFEQENLSYSQCHSQATEGSWPALNAGPFIGSQRQHLSNYPIHPSVDQRSYIHVSKQASHGMDNVYSAAKSDFFDNQVPNLNGLIHAPQVFVAKQCDRSVLGMGTGSDRNCLMSNMQFNGMQEESIHQNKKAYQSGASEFPVNFDFLGGQKPTMNTRQSGEMLFPRQQPVFSDVQLLQQQVLFKQMQEFRQQQLQQIERQQNSLNQPTFSKQLSGTSLPDSFAYPQSSEFIRGMQHGASVAMQSSSTGFIFSPDLGQVPLSTGLIHQQADQSFFGVPVTSTIASLGQCSHVQMDGPVLRQLPKFNDSFLTSQVYDLNNQFGVLGRASSQRDFQGKNCSEFAPSRHEYQGKNRTDFTSLQGIVNGGLLDNSMESTHENDVTSSRFRTMHMLPSMSETLQGSTERHVTSSQSFPPLDPTEEKILFGSDDNIWDTFGGDINNTVGSNSFSSIPCGTWSALMQSSLGEASSSEMGLQGRSSGFSLLARNSKSLEFNTSDDKQVVWPGDNVQMGSQIGSKFMSDPHAVFSSCNTQQNQPSELIFPNTHTELMQHCTSDRLTQQYVEGKVCLGQNGSERQFDDVNKIYGNAAQSSQMEATTKGLQGPWIQQSSISYNNSSQLCNVQNDWKTANSIPYDEKIKLMKHGNMGSLPNSSWGENRTLQHVKFDHPGSIMESSGVHYSNTDTNYLGTVGERLKGISPVLRNEEIQDMRTFQRLKMDSPFTNSLADDQALWNHEMHTPDKRDGGSYNSSFPAVGSHVRENVWLDASGSYTSVDKSRSSIPIVQKTRSLPKFQYHPMGISGVEPHPSEIGHVAQEYRQQVTQEGSSMKLHPVAADAKGSSRGKEHLPCVPEVKTGYGKVPYISPGDRQDCEASIPATSDGLTNLNVPTSQSMLDLLHKVDRPRDSFNFMSSKSYSGTVEADVSGGSTSHLKQSPPSQGFGLQLAPPSQKFSMSSRTPATMTMKQVSPEHGVPYHARSASSNFQSVPYDPSQTYNMFGTLEKTRANISVASEFPYSGGLSQELTVVTSEKKGSESIDTPADCASGFRTTDESCSRDMTSQSISSPGMTSCNAQDKKDALIEHVLQPISGPSFGSQKNVTLDASSATQAYVTSNVLQKGTSTAILLNSWSSLPPQPHNDLSNLLKSHFRLRHNSDRITKEDVWRDSSDRPETASSHMKSKEMLPMGKEMNQQGLCPSQNINSLETSVDNPCTSLGAYGDAEYVNHTRNIVQKNYSSSHHMQNLKGADGNQGMDRLRNHEKPKLMETSETEKQLHRGRDKDTQPIYTSTLHPESKKLKLSHEAESSHGRSVPSQNIPQADNSRRSESYDHTSDFTSTSLRTEKPRVSPQMAPSWFDQYGAFKRKQDIPACDVLRNANARAANDIFIVENSVAVPAQKFVDDCSGSAGIFTCQNLDPMPVPDIVVGQNAVITRPKKRKTDTSSLISWRKDLTCYSRVLHDISTSEANWAHRLNRLVEKIDENENSDHGMYILKPKRRLILTTQSMQQLFRPPPTFVLSADATSNSEDVIFFVTRSALRDACCLASRSAGDASSGSNTNEKSKSLGTSGDENVMGVTEGLVVRLRKLEKDFSGLDSKASILDLRMECDDLERFSIINCFAKFHGPRQAEGTDPKTSYQRFYLQRYVTALPMPGNLPEKVQCLSL